MDTGLWGKRPLWVMVSDVCRGPHSVTSASPIQTSLHMLALEDTKATGE